MYNSIPDKIRHLYASQPLFLDTETTGLHAHAEIIEICIIDFHGNVLINTLVKPRLPIPPDVTYLHGIDNGMVSTAPSWLTVWARVKNILENRTIGIYNVEFDLKMMQQSHLLNGLPWRPPVAEFFCIMRLFSDFFGSMKWFKLEEASQRLGIEYGNVHRAYADSLTARAVFLKLAELSQRDHQFG